MFLKTGEVQEGVEMDVFQQPLSTPIKQGNKKAGPGRDDII
jgi:hypothetical protein